MTSAGVSGPGVLWAWGASSLSDSWRATMKLSANGIGNALWVAAALMLPGVWLPYILSPNHPAWAMDYSSAEFVIHAIQNCVMDAGTLLAAGAVVKLLGEIRDQK